MNVTTRRLRSIGWIATLMVCAALVMVLAFRVNALRSQVHQSELRIVALKQDTMYLETEFETRANQQQLKTWNDVEFGYVAPTASQYLETERQLVAYAKPVEPDAPAPVRVASNDDSVDAAAAFPGMVSPLTGKPASEAADTAPENPAATMAGDEGQAPRAKHPAVSGAGPALAAAGLAGLGARLATVRHSGASDDQAAGAHNHAAPGTKAMGDHAKLAKAGARAGAKVSARPAAKTASPKVPGAKAYGMKASGAKSGVKVAGKASQASAYPHMHRDPLREIADAGRSRTPARGTRTPLIRLALKDARKDVKSGK
jgi:hypothetical protein